ncbi:magnesium-transporting ATPase (P-type) [Paenibacillus sp. V4I3]|nr:magnesium-transporting ATPase (P-type) [Paenibacillus sp. V4I3]
MSISVFQWMSGAIIRVGFAQFLLGEMMPFTTSRQRNWFNLLVTISYITLSMIPLEKYTIYLWMYRFYFPISLVVALFVSIVCISISLFSKKFKEETA